MFFLPPVLLKYILSTHVYLRLFDQQTCAKKTLSAATACFPAAIVQRGKSLAGAPSCAKVCMCSGFVDLLPSVPKELIFVQQSILYIACTRIASLLASRVQSQSHHPTDQSNKLLLHMKQTPHKLAQTTFKRGSKRRNPVVQNVSRQM